MKNAFFYFKNVEAPSPNCHRRGGTTRGWHWAGVRLLFILTLLPLFTIAQSLEWTWAQRGGGDFAMDPSQVSLQSHDYERIHEIEIDSNNNVYYIGQLGTGNENVNGTPIQSFSQQVAGVENSFLFSTDCNGNLRWFKSIGGDSDDFINGLGIDGNNNIYAAGFNQPPGGNNNIPIHFHNDTIANPRPTPRVPGTWAKKLYIISYDNNGNLRWLRQPQKDLIDITEFSIQSQIYVESNGTTHFLVGLSDGNHVDGQLPISNSPTFLEYRILRYDVNGNYLGDIDVPNLGGGSLRVQLFNIKMTYDPALQRYYIAGFKAAGSSNDITVNGTIIPNSMVLLAIDNTGNIVWRKDDMNTVGTPGASGGGIRDIIVDASNNVYICGSYGNSSILSASGTFAGYAFGQNHPTVDFTGGRTFVMKLDSTGNLLWGTDPHFSQPSNNRNFNMTLDGNDLYVAGNLNNNTWDGINFTYGGGGNTRNAPVVLRVNATTGVVQEIFEAGMVQGDTQAAMAIAHDSFGNLVVGGYMSGNLFNNVPNVAPISKSGGDSDFWMARLAKTDCNGVPLSTNDVTSTSFSIYPNPVDDIVTITGSDTSQLSTYAIYNLAGQVVQQDVIGSDHQIKVNQLTSGLYLLELSTQDGNVQTVKLVKE